MVPYQEQDISTSKVRGYPGGKYDGVPSGQSKLKAGATVKAFIQKFDVLSSSYRSYQVS